MGGEDTEVQFLGNQIKHVIWSAVLFHSNQSFSHECDMLKGERVPVDGGTLHEIKFPPILRRIPYLFKVFIKF